MRKLATESHVGKGRKTEGREGVQEGDVMNLGFVFSPETERGLGVS